MNDTVARIGRTVNLTTFRSAFLAHHSFRGISTRYWGNVPSFVSKAHVKANRPHSDLYRDGAIGSAWPGGGAPADANKWDELLCDIGDVS
jgi:hypothetical protein